ncbi:MAG: cellulase family glycosylhydrolase [Armatimonadota bacterium]
MKKINSFSYISSIVIFGMAATAICTALQKRPGFSARPVSQKLTELLTNGNYARGMKPWVLEQAGGAKGSMTVTKNGPGGVAALKVSIQNKGEQSWQVQLHQGGLKIEKGRKYTLSYWAKAERPTVITVNCMQNHEPWEHHGAASEVSLTNKWEKRTFSFSGPWDDTNARITFTNLATQPGAAYWFSNVSLVAGPQAPVAAAKPTENVSKMPAQPTRVVVWDGETARTSGGWANPPTSSYAPKIGEAHSGDTALEFKFDDDNVWIGCGLHWFDWKKGTNIGTDIRSMTHLTFWIKAQGSTGDLDAQLLCNGDVLDTPEHHTSKTRIAKYCPDFRDGNWHEVAIPLTDLVQPDGFDPRIVSQLDLGINPSGKVSGSFLIDDIAFENRGSAQAGLRVVGKQLRDAKGNLVRLQGVNVPSLDWSPVGEHVMESIDVAIDGWNANIIRIPLTQDLWFGYEKGQQKADRGESYRKIVDDIVKKIAEKNCYVLLDLHWSDAGQWGQNVGQHKMPDANTVVFWKDFAKRYANNPAVLFDLYNEPHSVSWEIWKNGGQVEDSSKGVTYRSPGMQTLLNTVRSTGAKNVVVAGGLDWAYDLRGVLSGYGLNDPSGNGIVYATHIYPWKKDWDANVTPVFAKYPVIVGEVGTKPWKEGDPPHENVYTEDWAPAVMAYIEKHKLNWTAWSFHPSANPCIITDWSYKPTSYWGKYVKEALANRKKTN